VAFIDAIPKAASGKILRRVLRVKDAEEVNMAKKKSKI
jgi:acyl-coenzyme A synthetase/AMP-(fatty) acid ligase